jgi:hypothetical protein
MRFRRGVVWCVAGALTAAMVVVPPAWAVVGGWEVASTDFRSIVRLVVGPPGAETAECTGNLIYPGVILTAAHCVDDADGQVTAHLRNGRASAVGEIVVHPLWNGDFAGAHDLAILEIDPFIMLGFETPQVGSPATSAPYLPGTPAFIVGFGKTSASSDTSPDKAQFASVYIRTDEHMEDLYDPFYWFDGWDSFKMIGAGSSTRTMCGGDSGGPLLTHLGTRLVQVGVASFTDEGACDQATAFMKLSGSQLAFIAQHVPQIKQDWGPCTYGGGAPGVWSAYYVSFYRPAANVDGGFYWEIACGPPGTTKPPTTSPTEERDPKVPPICVKHPGRCPKDI